MKTRWRYALAAIGAGALVGPAASTALARPSAAARAHVQHQAAKRQTVNGQLYVTDVVHMNKNVSVYGTLYAHNSEQVWKGLIVKQGLLTAQDGLTVTAGGIKADSLQVSGQSGVTVAAGGLTVQSGGIKSDSLVVSGPISATDATVSGNLATGTLQATGTINGTAINLAAGGTGGGTLTAAGKITGNGVEAGAGGVSTTGTVTAQNVTATGTLSAGTANLTNLAVSGNVNFSNATVTGLNLGQINLNGVTATTLTVGTPASNSAPLFVSSNGRTAQVGVNSSGALTVTDLTVGGNFAATNGASVTGALAVSGVTTLGGDLVANGTHGITTSLLQGTPAPSSSSPGPLTLTGSAITANGTLTLGDNSDLVMGKGTGSTNSTHVLANTDKDVAGVVGVSVTNSAPGTGGFTGSITFDHAFAAVPYVVVSPASDPQVAGSNAVRWWVAPTTLGFVVHLMTANTPSSSSTVNFYYHVIGQ